MQDLQAIIKNLQLKSLSNSTQEFQPTKSESITYKCRICKDREYIYFPEDNSVADCECVQAKKYQRLIERSGISDAFKQKSFNNFTTKDKDDAVVRAKAQSLKYVDEFINIKNTRNNSILMMGQPGSGKTHLCIAISNELLKKGTGVLYMSYREAIPLLKQSVTDEESYQREIYKYKSAPVLFIDDLYKGNLTKSDINISFEIINYRYIKNLPMIISTEFLTTNLLEFDEATGSRIIEMSKDYILELVGKSLNYRLL